MPDVECDGAGLCVGSEHWRDVYFVGASLSHRGWQTEEYPVVEFADEAVVGVHGLGFAPYG